MFTSRIVEYEAQKKQQKSLNIKIKHQKLMFDSAMLANWNIGLTFFMRMLTVQIIPTCSTVSLGSLKNRIETKIMFQQDAAQTNFSLRLKQWLKKPAYKKRYIGFRYNGQLDNMTWRHYIFIYGDMLRRRYI